MDPRSRAVIDSVHCVKINFEAYFVSTPEARRAFEARPLAYCGRLTDPVSLLRFTPTPRSPRLEWSGRPYYFSSDSTRALFASDPDSFSVPRFRMLEMM